MVNQKNSLAVVPIRIQFDNWSPESCLLDPKPTEYQRKISTGTRGRVVSETITEYKDFNDEDSDFAGLGEKLANFARLQRREDREDNDDVTPKNESPKREVSSSSDEDEEDAGEKMEQFQEEMLKTHNEKRRAHGVKDLKLSKTLCEYAQEWADKLAAEDSFEHRPSNEYGENLYMSWSSNPKADVSGEIPSDSWYSEVSKHDFGAEPMSTGTGHFTQMVWKGSKKLGVAKARSAGGKIIVVANYEPAGNVIGRYVQNVLPAEQ